MDPTSWKRNDTPTHLSNPLKHDVVVELFDDENKRVSYVVPSIEIVTYPKWLADVLKKHIVDTIINDRGLGYLSPEQRMEITKEVEVEI